MGKVSGKSRAVGGVPLSSGDEEQGRPLACWGEFEYDPSSRELRRRGLKVKLQPMVLQVLGLLLERPGEVVTREELHHKVWNGYAYSDFDHNLNIAINKLRTALNDPAKAPKFIETVPQSGYRFLQPVDLREEIPPAAAPPAAGASPVRLRLVLGAAAVALLVLAGLVAFGRRAGPTVEQRGAGGSSLAGVNLILPGQVGGPFRLSGSGVDYVRVPNNSLLEPTHVTVEAWVRSEEPPGNYRYVLAKGAARCEAASYALYTGSEGGLVFYVSEWEDMPVAYLGPDAGKVLWDGQWHHAVGTFDGAAVRLFIDGEELPEATRTPEDFKVAYNLPTDNDLLVGSYAGSCSAPFRGEIDDVHVFSRALTAAEVQESFKRTALQRNARMARRASADPPGSCVAPPKGMVAWWAGEGHLGDLGGALKGQPVGPVRFVPGKVGQGIRFPYGGARVVVPESPALELTEGLTIETWMNVHLPQPENYDDQIVPVIVKWSAASQGGGYGLFVDYSGRSYFRVRSLSGEVFEVSTRRSIAVSRYAHVAGMVGGGTLRLYVDGVAVDATPFPGRIRRDSAPLLLGGLGPSPRARRNFGGTLDEVTVYSRALSAEEIQSIFTAGPQGKCKPASLASRE